MTNIRKYCTDDQAELWNFLSVVFTDMGRSFLLDGKDADVKNINDNYIENHGAFYILHTNVGIQGCIGLRKISNAVSELKRFYIGTQYRGKGYGKKLCSLVISDAKAMGYKFIRLDTSSESPSAIAVFKKFHFYDIERYDSAPNAEIYMEHKISDA
jgi:RimJ/RimL family protein N-acetyltransferase